MNTPICDFVKAYDESRPLRLHMPGHKGVSRLGCEGLDITEIEGADVLYRSSGIIRESEENAAALFGTARTVYSTEGSSLCIRAMLYLAMQHTGRRRILAGRNAHATFVTAAALLDAQVQWLLAAGGGLTACPLTAEGLSAALDTLPEKPAAVYVTSPDYLGNTLDIAALARVCHDHDTLLLVDNAHGAYLRFLPADCHPITLGADLCCDSAHKTLPVLTGGAYLHVAHRMAALWESAEHAMSLFASTSPSYLTLQSLDATNAYLAGDYPARLADACRRVAALKEALVENGYPLAGQEPLKVTLAPKAYGYTGEDLAARLEQEGVVCEFADPDYVVMMFTPENGEEATECVRDVLCALPRRSPIGERAPQLTPPQRRITLRQALFAAAETLPLADCVGRVLAAPTVSCPPAVPVLVGGEVVDESALEVFRYYGYTTLGVVKEYKRSRGVSLGFFFIFRALSGLCP